MPYLISLNATFNAVYLRTVMAESKRVARGKPVWVHSWYEYMLQGAPTVPDKPTCAHEPNGCYDPDCVLSRENLGVMVNVPKDTGAAGIIVWGGGADQSTQALCKSFKAYFNSELGPAIAAAVGGSSANGESLRGAIAPGDGPV